MMQQEGRKCSLEVICSSNDLGEKQHLLFELNYRKSVSGGILIRYEGQVYGYLNLCAHMPKRLDCECDQIFTEDGSMLRCSMHGITYDPTSGEARSEICQGEKLTSIKINESDGKIFLRDRKASLISEV